MATPDEADEIGHQQPEPMSGRRVDRRQFLVDIGRAGAALGAFGVLGAACSGDGDGNTAQSTTRSPSKTTGASDRDVSGLPKRLKIGVVAPFDGLGKFLGDIVERSLAPALRAIADEELFPGITIELVKQNARAEDLATGTSKAYNALVSDPEIIGILWGTPFGLDTLQGALQRDNIPIISMISDEETVGRLYPKGPARSVFQLLLPDRMAIDELLKYASSDREYESVALLHDNFLYPDMKYVESIATKHDIELVGVEEFSISTADYGSQLGRTRDKKPHCLLIWGLAESTAGIVKQLDALGAGYVDTPSAKSGEWRPHIMGSPAGTGERRWAQLAGASAKTGSLTCWYAGGFGVGLPTFPIHQWSLKYANSRPTGGEDIPANGLYALLESARMAKSTDRAAMVDALEHFRGTFASLEFSFTADRHLAIREQDLALATLERVAGTPETDPPYVLGKEARETYEKVDQNYTGPTLLVRPSYERLRKAHPDLAELVLTEGYGIQCTKHPADAKGMDIKLTKECKIH